MTAVQLRDLVALPDSRAGVVVALAGNGLAAEVELQGGSRVWQLTQTLTRVRGDVLTAALAEPAAAETTVLPVVPDLGALVEREDGKAELRALLVLLDALGGLRLALYEPGLSAMDRLERVEHISNTAADAVMDLVGRRLADLPPLPPTVYRRGC